ncbi:hypothetical protein CUMW_154640 [Citrus unshiu]|nr:hypothetical protein CUMW_154640 [Citrus unshiu]
MPDLMLGANANWSFVSALKDKLSSEIHELNGFELSGCHVLDIRNLKWFSCMHVQSVSVVISHSRLV